MTGSYDYAAGGRAEMHVLGLSVRQAIPSVRPVDRSWGCSCYHNNSIATTANSDRPHETQVQGWVMSRSQRPIKEKRLSSRYLHTYNLYCFHNLTSDPHDETLDQVQIWMTLTYLSMSQILKGKSLSSWYHLQLSLDVVVQTCRSPNRCFIHLIFYSTVVISHSV